MDVLTETRVVVSTLAWLPATAVSEQDAKPQIA